MGNYEKALELYEFQAKEQTKSGQRSDATLNNKATAQLCLERYEDARDTYRNLQADYEKRGAPFSARLDLSVATWLCGDREQAIELAKREIDAIRRRETGYLSSEFGVEEGRLLYYFGAASNDQSAIDQAMGHLKRLRSKPLGPSSPPGLLEFLLDEITQQGALALIRERFERSGVEVSPEVSARAKSIVLPRDEMALDFCVATKVLAHSGTLAASPLFAQIAAKHNPLLLSEWYLARAF